MDERWRWRSGNISFAMNGQTIQLDTIMQRIKNVEIRCWPHMKNLRRNVATCSLAVTMIAETGHLFCKEVDIAVDDKTTIHISGCNPKESIVSEEGFSTSDMFSYPDGRQEYARELFKLFDNMDDNFKANVLSQYEETHDIGMGDVMLFLSNYSENPARKGAVFNNYFTHSEDFIIHNLLFRNGLIDLLVKIFSSCDDCQGSIVSMHLLIHSKLDICSLCSRKLAAVNNFLNSKGIESYLEIVRRDYPNLCWISSHNGQTMWTVFTQSRLELGQRRIECGHDNHSHRKALVDYSTMLSTVSTAQKYYYIQCAMGLWFKREDRSHSLEPGFFSTTMQVHRYLQCFGPDYPIINNSWM